MTYAEEFKNEIAKLVDAADTTGPFFTGSELSFVDVQIAPWVIRLNRVLKPYRGWPDPEPGSRWAEWVEAIEKNEHVQATTSTDELYLDSYERYAGKSGQTAPSVVVLCKSGCSRGGPREPAGHVAACQSSQLRPGVAVELRATEGLSSRSGGHRRGHGCCSTVKSRGGGILCSYSGYSDLENLKPGPFACT